ncbi:MAG: hypothetical protein OHK0029_31390 [Armatimonadaceae bacterium]
MLTHHIATTTSPPATAPSGKRFPFGWEALAVVPNVETPRLTFTASPEQIAGRLRFTVALDDREEKSLEAVLAESGETVGRFDLRYADTLQTVEVKLDPLDTFRAQSEGIYLRLTRGSSPLYVLRGTVSTEEEGDAAPDAGEDASGKVPALLCPHLLTGTSGDRWFEFGNRLCSEDSLEAFGWHEGCVLDGLVDLAEARPKSNAEMATQQHLRRFISPDGLLVYENPHSEPFDGRIYGIEGTLPFAPLAKTYPDHPLISLATMFWKDRIAENGSVTDSKIATAEGMYTAAYPMAIVSRVRRIDWLADAAIMELRLRRERLVHEDSIYLRFNPLTGERTFRNWSRGVAWYLLGMARSLVALEDRENLEDLREEYRRAALWVQEYQVDGLWRAFLDDPESRVETSGSAGIAAALAIGAQHGLLERDARLAAARTLTALTAHLTPDGLLTGVAPSNKGGEPLQRSGYRVIMKTGMGLVGVLMGALSSKPTT